MSSVVQLMTELAISETEGANIEQPPGGCLQAHDFGNTKWGSEISSS